MERDQVDPEVERRGGATPPPKLRFDYGGEKVRGVSLGGWLVVEDFITPNVYSSTGNSRIIDEWTFGSLQSKSKATSILQKHLDGFVGEEDFERMASLGLNHVRIPIGYWAFEVGEGEPFLKLNQWNLLKKAAGWAGKNGLKVLVDLHAVPGSANGFDHGGRKGHNEWASKRSYVERTLAILRTMSNEFSKPEYSNSVSAIELVNEPVTDSKVVLDFYKRGYGVVRNSSSPSPLLVVIGDEFKSPALTDYWRKRLTPPEYQGLAIDSHVYTIFDDDSIRLSPSDRVSHYCSLLPELSRANSDHWQLIGEWSPSPTDCAQGLNGRGKGSRYQGDLPGSRGKVGECSSKTGDASHFSKGYKRLLATLWQAQVESYEGGMGWIMWTWKTQSGKAEEWSYLKGVEHGWIPEDPTSRPQGVIC
ncbi:glycoside hydrolase [Violaceomyces palustris]|uniref:Glycoside hydrolase n=1 Tax=Violaceomyces palustris TaxID=1673888 RepID=A0ACD0NLD7_9BASI|nr:glycoside hydrolase [Violaceomyces palustris]